VVVGDAIVFGVVGAGCPVTSGVLPSPPPIPVPLSVQAIVRNANINREDVIKNDMFFRNVRLIIPSSFESDFPSGNQPAVNALSYWLANVIPGLGKTPDMTEATLISG
jgi:hypothetical protein